MRISHLISLVITASLTSIVGAGGNPPMFGENTFSLTGVDIYSDFSSICCTHCQAGGVSALTDPLDFTINMGSSCSWTKTYDNAKYFAYREVDSTINSPYDYLLPAGQFDTGIHQHIGRLKVYDVTMIPKLGVKNDTCPVGYIRYLTLGLVNSRKESIYVYLNANTPYRECDYGAHSAFDPIAFTSPNTPTDIRDTIFAEALAKPSIGGDPFNFPVICSGWMRSFDSSTNTMTGNSPSNADYAYYGNGGSWDSAVETITFSVIKHSDGYYYMNNDDHRLTISMRKLIGPNEWQNYEEQIADTKTITNLGPAGPFDPDGNGSNEMISYPDLMAVGSALSEHDMGLYFVYFN